MTNEEMQRIMKLIRERQEQVAASLHRIKEERRRDIPRIARLEESFQLLGRLAQKHGLM